ncbi:UV-damaged DNA-binding protein rad7 [Parahypoxylon ruwenzoriense]
MYVSLRADTLTERNISAHRIVRDAEARRVRAIEYANANAAAAAAADAAADATIDAVANVTGPTATADIASPREVGGDVEGEMGSVSAKYLKRKAQFEAIRKIKRSKTFERRKKYARSLKGKKGSGDDNDDEDEDEGDDILAMELSYAPAGSLNLNPGQTENCELCKKRFTVTPYSRAGPEGGLLCQKCGKKLAEEDSSSKNKRKKSAAAAGTNGRRKTQSKILDGKLGVKSLMTLCVETLANNIGLADSLGDLPPYAIDCIARHLSKRRLLNAHTLQLFLHPEAEDISLYDAARLNSDDYVRIFQTCAKLKNLKLRNAIQFNDDVMKYLLGRHITLGNLYLHGANLLSQTCWGDYLKTKGKSLKGLHVYYTDRHFSDEIVESLKTYCPSLTRLKICHNQQVSDEGVKQIAHLRHLECLSLQLVQQTSTEPYVDILRSIGGQLRTFSLRRVGDVDDRLLDALHEHCAALTKLRITHSEKMTDAGFARLFKGWKCKRLAFIDLELCRHVDSTHPRENSDELGLCSNGFRAIMNHSSAHLKKLNVHGCRHISREAFEDAFSADKVYPSLLDLEISFCEEVTDFIVGSIFRSCPNLKMLNIFGCMKVKEVRVPRGKILVGMPNAMGMVIEGSDD